MIKNFILPAFACVLLASISSSCSSNNKPENSSDRVDSSAMSNSSDTTLSPVADMNRAECYQYTQKRDTISLNLKQDNQIVTGELSYLFYEKDKSRGTIAGEMRGDTLLADYTFDSEGMRSVREVIFIKKDGKLLEGYGDMEEKGGKMVFKNRQGLKFGDGVVLSKSACN